MEREDIREFLGKEVTLFDNRGYRFQGTVISVNNTHLVLDDRKISNLKIMFEDVKTIGEIKKKEGENGGTNS